jgi:hypothetical protein
VRDNRLIVGCEAAFHRDTLADEKRSSVLEQVLAEVLGTACAVEFVVKSDVRDLMRGEGPSGPPPGDLFVDAAPARPADASPGRTAAPRASGGSGEPAAEIRAQLLNHPVVKELQRRGGQVADIDVFGQEDLGGKDGK